MSLEISEKVRNLDFVLGALFCILVGGFFILPTSPHRIILYFILILGLSHIKKNNNWAFAIDFKNKIFVSVCAFLFYAFISNFWSDIEDTERLLQKTKPAIFIFLFLIVGQSFFKDKVQVSKLWVEVYIISAVFTAVILIFMNAGQIYSAYENNDLWRLNGFGRAENSNQAGLFYGIALLSLFFHRPTYNNKLFDNKIFRIVCILCLLSVFFLALSRGAFFAFLCTLFLVIIVKMYLSDIDLKLIFLPLLSIILATIIIFCFFPHLLTYMIERGTTGRFELWQQGFDQFLQRPLWGHGAGTKFYYELQFPTHVFVAGHLHSLYMAVLVHFGLIGFSLFSYIIYLILIGLIGYVRDTNNYSILIIFVFGCAFGLVDLGGHYNSLSTSWLLFWIPALVVIAYQKQGASEEGSKID